ncbi:MAG: hypothetical protein EAZ09_03575 [Oscillatoriales cyanobacterium]|jgi:hypothetical protein|uniref:hypothetical protein n=1 Tax=Tychonema sp. BBK16 TaxID=2699888 RepID=UPI001F1B32B5|nr:hypothetical protein [Tychonema sp. BBK16]MCF6375230.1 hypothetical protein [Tychonema sp. BBK16]TAG98446.1 MAG: hypothetical protein EAZ18_00860 [Oscillatoriales cyanobacterium]TAH24587.1 MAG: hypothetical protein EAZ09_03575 [Oscillatoriales cyanobacterium]
MAYSDFNLNKVTSNFELTISDKIDMFAAVSELESSTLLTEILKDNVPLALSSNTEKSRSEMIIAPILLEFRKQFKSEISLFSGIDFTIDPEKGLNGSCDFLISHSSELLLVRAPVIIIVEAKKENINGGLGQCVAEMLAARIFNEREGNEIPAIYGAVTSGTNWKFLKLKDQIIEIDLTEYYLRDVNKILGILASVINH